jgi:hypothetical protein
MSNAIAGPKDMAVRAAAVEARATAGPKRWVLGVLEMTASVIVLALLLLASVLVVLVGSG